jgi:carbon-monoxide dehydrogenase medium subunit
MKPNRFQYIAAQSIPDALRLLNTHQSDVKIIAGGQSLIPMLNYRVLNPHYLIDIGRILELDYISEKDGLIEIGAITPYVKIENSSLIQQHLPIVSEVIRHIAHLTIRNRGTIGGSLSHADPASEMPMLMRLLDAHFEIRSESTSYQISAHDFFLGPLHTVLQNQELLTKILIKVPSPQMGWAFQEFARRSGDYALAAVGITLEIKQQSGKKIIDQLKIAMMGVGDTPLRLSSIEALMNGQEFSADLLDQAKHQIFTELDPRGDLQSSAEFKKHLASNIFTRVMSEAWDKANSYQIGSTRS